MRLRVFVCLLCSLLLLFTGCRKPASVQPSLNSQSASRQESGSANSFNACELLEKKEIEAIQGSPIKETKSSALSDAAFRISQCFYTAAEFSKSVSLALIQRDPGRPTTTSPKDFWKERFGRYSADEKERDKAEKVTQRREEKEEKEEAVPPKKIEGVGDEAFWASNRFGGVLYVLQGDAFISVSVGGPDNEETKIKKSKALAQTALQDRKSVV